MKGGAKSVVIRRQNRPKTQMASRSIVSPPYKKKQDKQKSQTSKSNNSVAPKFISVIDDPKLESLRQSVEKEESLEDISNEDLKLLLAHTREYQQTCAIDRQYQLANDAKELAQRIRQELYNRRTQMVPDEKAVQDAEKQAQKKLDMYEQSLSVYEEQTRQGQEDIERRQEKSRAMFEDRWNELEPRRYQKSSPTLLQMKEIEKNLILAGEYLQAQEANKRIIQETNKEFELRQYELNEDYSAAKSQFDQKQKTELEIFFQNRKAKCEALSVKRDKELQIIQNRQNVVKQKKIGTRCPKSTLMNSNENIATSFQHIAKEHNFGIINPILPKLNPPSDKRQYRIKAQKTRPITPNPPHAYRPKNDSSFASDDQSSTVVFQTSVSQSRLKNAPNRTYQDDEKGVLENQLDGMSNFLTDSVSDSNTNNEENKGTLEEVIINITSGIVDNNDDDDDKNKEENQDQ